MYKIIDYTSFPQYLHTTASDLISSAQYGHFFTLPDCIIFCSATSTSIGSNIPIRIPKSGVRKRDVKNPATKLLPLLLQNEATRKHIAKVSTIPTTEYNHVIINPPIAYQLT